MEVFHSGEREVQKKVGVLKQADSVGRMVQPYIPKSIQSFIEVQPLLAIGTTDSKGRIWASLISGYQGFIRVIDQHTISIQAPFHQYEQLYSHLQHNPNVGMIVIEFSRRIRIRINGYVAALDEGRIIVKTEQVYGNCPKYIQARKEIKRNRNCDLKLEEVRGMRLNKEQRSWINKSDTFFISSANALGKTDISHRGGQPGFVYVVNDTKLLFSDYLGNMMFNTLGNVVENPNTGLLFINFEHGHTLQLTGTSRIIWEMDGTEKAQFPGAERLIEYTINEVTQTNNAHDYNWDFISYSPYNPK